MTPDDDTASAASAPGRARAQRLGQQGAWGEAARELDRLLAEAPDDPELLAERGRAALALNAAEDAAAWLERARQAGSPSPATTLLAATAQLEAGNADRALALLADPPPDGHAVGWTYQRGRARLAQGDDPGAEAELRRTLDRAPGHRAARSLLAGICYRREAWAEAEAILLPAIAAADRHEPDRRKRAHLYNSLANIRIAQGRHAAARAALAQVVALTPEADRAYRYYLHMLHFDPEQTEASLSQAMHAWAAWHARPREAEAQAPPPAPADKRRLTVAVLESRVYRHTQLWLLLPALENLDPAAIRLIVYHMGRHSDDQTRRLAARADAWRNVRRLSDAALAEQIRADGTDIALHTATQVEGRLPALAYRPAPVQVQWTGFNTTGMASIDWFLGDPVECPPVSDAYFAESVYRLPDGYIAYLPPDRAPAVARLPAAEHGYITFGNLNQPRKTNLTLARSWAEILARVPNSRLIQRVTATEWAQERPDLLALLGEAGIPKERVELVPPAPQAELLNLYNRIDISLDPWPFSGGLTTLESLWMGVPVVTRPGPSFAGRHSASHLTNAGLRDWVQASWAGYIDHAVAWANDIPALAELRAGLREQVRASPLCDGPRFARNLTAALVDMHRRAAEGR